MTTNKREKYLKLQNGSDIRGVSLTGVPGESLSLREEEAKEIAIGFIIWLSDKLDKRPEDMTLAIGRDPRTSGPRLLDGLMDGFGEYGCKVYDFGYASTPAMFMATVFEDLEENVEDPRIRLCRLFDFVEEDDAEGVFFDGIGQLAAFLIADVARGGAD